LKVVQSLIRYQERLTECSMRLHVHLKK